MPVPADLRLFPAAVPALCALLLVYSVISGASLVVLLASPVAAFLTVRFTSETAQHLGSVEIAGDTGQVQRYFPSKRIDEYPR